MTPSVSSSARDRSHEMNTEYTNDTDKANTPLRSYDMYGMTHLLVQEHLSRARMPKPQSTSSEASRPARVIAMHSRKEQRRIMGHW